jgi:hypothetical protein
MPEEGRESVSGLVFAAAIMLGLFFCGAALPRDPDFDSFFGVEAYRTPGPAVLLLAELRAGRGEAETAGALRTMAAERTEARARIR